MSMLRLFADHLELLEYGPGEWMVLADGVYAGTIPTAAAVWDPTPTVELDGRRLELGRDFREITWRRQPLRYEDFLADRSPAKPPERPARWCII